MGKRVRSRFRRETASPEKRARNTVLEMRDWHLSDQKVVARPKEGK